MSGGRTNQSSNYNSSIAFSPVISGHGSIQNGNISTGSTTGSLNGSSTGASGGLDLKLSPMLQMLPFSCYGNIQCTAGPIQGNAGFNYSNQRPQLI